MSIANATMIFPHGEKVVPGKAACPGLAVPSADLDARRISASVARGDETAFAELYDAYHGRLFHLALVLAHGDELLARDAVQSAMLTAARKLRALNSEAHLWNWLARIVRQQLGKLWRDRQTAPMRLEIAECPEVAAAASDAVLEEWLDAGLRELSAEDRQLLEWFYFDRLAHKLIAERLEITPKAVSSRLERARAALRSIVKRKRSHEC